ncbi:TIGR04076 family protein [Marivita sp.]|uniref:TIGR04076 family protein n=1 Tax=Marivita sp. TaxID=2003365 RepID=UPI0025BF7263|nr:TIGR04076 family protein [Marivita sp.]
MGNNRGKRAKLRVGGTMSAAQNADEFWLYDLQVETVVGDRTSVCRHVEGERFRVEGELLVFDAQQKVSMYALAALLPLLPAKQRPTHDNDWMSTDAEIACPDPNCGGRFRVTRTTKRSFTHAETTGLPDQRGTPYWKDET